MKTTQILLFISLFITTNQAIAQPGGGGGVTIKHVYDSLGTEINTENDSNYTLACYLLNDTLFASRNIYSKLDNEFESFNTDSVGYVPDYRDTSKLIQTMFIPKYKYKAIRLESINSMAYEHFIGYDNFRIMLSTQKDTIIVDFIKVIGENGHGIQCIVDSITFNPGYFQFKKKRIYPKSYPEDTFWKVDALELDAFSALITNEKRFHSLKEFHLERSRDERKKTDQEFNKLIKSEEWKQYDEEKKEYLLGLLIERKNAQISFRERYFSK